MKFSVSIGDHVYDEFCNFARKVADGNLSLLAAIAIKEVLKRPPSEIAKLVEIQRYDRQFANRSAWMKAYWNALGILMEQPDHDAFNSPYSPRTFGKFYAVLLMNRIGQPDEEADPFFPYIGPQPVTPDSPAPRQWTFLRTTTPLIAAEAVANQLRNHGAFN
ncbi:MAG TPA: hypothetical protein VGF98_10815 [Candidatus Tumulicola sp.]|jgi:hypothetical protein